MIGNKTVLMYCSGDITKIENFKEALHDSKRTWECHHRLENNPDGSPAFSSKELKGQGRYFGRPPSEFIFLPPEQHRKLKKKVNRNNCNRRKDDVVSDESLLMYDLEIEIDRAIDEVEADIAEHPEDYRQVYKVWYCIREHADRISYLKEKAKYDRDPEKYKAEWDKTMGFDCGEMLLTH